MIGFIPAFWSVLYNVMNPSIRCSFFRDLIPVAMIVPASLSPITITYQFPPAVVWGKTPVWLVDVIPFKSSNFIAVICT